MLNFLARFSEDESGATAVEYGLIVALMVIAMSVGLTGVARETTNMWTNISESMTEAMKNAR
ncbi:Flp family type IVb pilin [Croceicoccus bisphenolivorans]|uniref:Flp family type IVb pilin n=1 Tax=Croceicoccus bisphenolivorans TaxID=1783232 RepID=UPI00082D2C27|nr:Flp family type IVb pilin [Croceicoccus bisphenolivorans]